MPKGVHISRRTTLRTHTALHLSTIFLKSYDSDFRSKLIVLLFLVHGVSLEL